MEELDKVLPISEENDGERDECFFCTSKKEYREVSNDQFLEWLVEITGKSKQDYLDSLTEKGEIQ